MSFLPLPRTFQNRNFTAVFGDRTSFRAKGLPRHTQNFNCIPQFLAIKPHFVKGLSRTFRNRNFTSVFGDRTSFRAKGLRPTLQFYLSFWRSNLLSCERVAAEVVKSQFYFSFDDRTSFRAKGLRFVPSRWHCPAP